MVKVLIPCGALGLGYDPAALARGITQKPDIIAIDGGSTDSGPHYLGTGTSKYSRGSTKAEWRDLMAARAARVSTPAKTAPRCTTPGPKRRGWWLCWIVRAPETCRPRPKNAPSALAGLCVLN